MTEEDLGAQAMRLLAQDAAGIRPKTSTAAVSDRSASSSVLGGASTNWRTLRDEGAPVEWKSLRDWVEWLTVRYGLPQSMIPNCWWRHDALVEELSALHCAHRAAFDSRDTGNGPLGWHERFATALPRLRNAYGGGCTERHQAIPPRSWVGATDEREWDAWITQSHAH
ncbi:hypothetical protein [Microbacterium pumilum]|uniref:Uncharacterized protein n=1 Tax=Microbacterium pumilum TaxID=344165 RepID=A0ABP5DF77_9MICO